MINAAVLVGRIGRKETRDLKNGGKMTVLSLETTKNYIDSKGQPQEQATWHNVNCFSKLSEYVERVVNINDLVFVQGEIQLIRSKSSVGDSHVYHLHANQIRLINKDTKFPIKRSDEQVDGNILSPTDYDIFC